MFDEGLERPIAQQIGHLIPVTDGVQALHGHIAGVVGSFACDLRPLNQRGVQAFAHFLRLRVQHLLRHLFPGEAEIAHHGNHAQADGASRGKQQRAGIPVVVLGFEVRGNRFDA